MKKQSKILGIFGLLMIVFFVLFVATGKGAEAAPVNRDPIITNDRGVVLNDSVVGLDDNEFYRTNSTTTATNSPVIGRKIIVNLSGKSYGLPHSIHYTRYQLGFAIPFQGLLTLVGTYDIIDTTYGIYTGNAVSYLN